MEKKIAIITGGAGFIGSHTAETLLRDGYITAICDINYEALMRVENELSKYGEVSVHRADIRIRDEVKRVVSDVYEKYGRIDLFVSVAGGSTREKMAYFCDQTAEVIDDNIQMNFFGALYFAHEISKIMAKQNFGKMVFVTSVLATNGQPGTVEYSASKGALVSMARALAQEMGEMGVTVNCVSPGLVQRDKRDVGATNFLGKNCSPYDIANAISFLASDKADFITGQNLIVDGGWGIGVHSCIKSYRQRFLDDLEKQKK
ncbi:MAG: SDR family oxidoreductase [Ruminococcaceae bacterium]|nr:SDR family oxidoreductase [Oscillospiraceae bacterium]